MLVTGLVEFRKIETMKSKSGRSYTRLHFEDENGNHVVFGSEIGCDPSGFIKGEIYNITLDVRSYQGNTYLLVKEYEHIV